MGKFNNWVTSKLRNWLDVEQLERGVIPMTEYNKTQTDKLKFRLGEYSSWYSGQEEQIETFYKNAKYGDNFRDTLFWSKVNGKVRKLHVGLPQQISEIMANITFAPGVTVDVNILNESGEIDETASDAAQATLKAIMKENKSSRLHIEAAETESWGGFTDFKLSIDTDVSEYPIIEVVQPDTFNVDTIRNRIVRHNYEYYFNVGKQQYVRVEGYEKGLITNKLYKLNHKGERKEVGLETTLETQDLLPIIELVGYNEIPAVYKPNKLPNNEFRGSMIGESDYAGIEGQFDALDEIASTMIDTVRKTRLKRFIQDDLLPRDPNGNTLPLDDFDMDYVVVQGAPGSDESPKDGITTSHVDLKTAELINSYNNTYRNILRNAGISPATIETDNIGANASGDSLREREKATDKTSRRKQDMWAETLEELYVKALQLNDVLNERTPAEYEVTVIFNRYIDTFESRIATAKLAIEGKVMSIRRALEIVFDGQLTEEEIEVMVSEIYTEQAIITAIEEDNAPVEPIIEE